MESRYPQASYFSAVVCSCSLTSDFIRPKLTQKVYRDEGMVTERPRKKGKIYLNLHAK